MGSAEKVVIGFDDELSQTVGPSTVRIPENAVGRQEKFMVEEVVKGSDRDSDMEK